jgi:DNA modification methylase
MASNGRAIILRGDARNIPLADNSVDLVCTSPPLEPYFGLRSYIDGGRHYEGQIGSEETPQEWVAAMLDCTREWMRVLKPSGSMFVNLGDKYSDRGHGPNRGNGTGRGPQAIHLPQTRGPREKSLQGLPWRYALACMDDLGLILRRDNIWHKTNPLPESAADRCATRHEYIFHFTMQPRYYSAVDEIREATPDISRKAKSTRAGRLIGSHGASGHDGNGMRMAEAYNNALGKLPGSVWEIPSQPLKLPGWLPADHFAAFPLELPRRCILGWSPPGICTACGEGRRPVADVANVEDRKGRKQRVVDYALDGAHGPDGRGGERWKQAVRITDYACACTPCTDHAGATSRRSHDQKRSRALGDDVRDNNGRPVEPSAHGAWREYHLESWAPPPTRSAIVLDPFGGTGSTALVADALGRTGISCDRSADYCRAARWRTTDPGERAKALQVPKPPPVADGQDSLFAIGEVPA